MEPGRLSWIRPTLGIGIVLVAIWVAFLYQSRVRIVPAQEARAASELVLNDVNGRVFALEDHIGRVVVLNVWASWCGPCRAEIPAFSRVYDDLRGEGLEVFGLNVDELTPRQVAEFTERFRMTYPVVFAATGFGGSFENPTTIPHTWLIDRAGRVRASHAGILTESSLRLAVRGLLEES